MLGTNPLKLDKEQLIGFCKLYTTKFHGRSFTSETYWALLSLQGGLISSTALLEMWTSQIFSGDLLFCLTGGSLCNLDSITSMSIRYHCMYLYVFPGRLSWTRRTSATTFKDILFSTAIVKKVHCIWQIIKKCIV